MIFVTRSDNGVKDVKSAWPGRQLPVLVQDKDAFYK